MAAHRHSLDRATAERLAAGRLATDDAPPGYRRVASLLQAAGAAPSATLGAAGTAPIGDLAAAIRSELASPQAAKPSRRPRMLAKLALGKALVALSAATLSATAAGAATGHLPDSLQDKVANAVEHVGVNLPHSAGHGVARVTDGCVPAADGTYARNRGQYLAQERAKGTDAYEAAKNTRCGMPVQSKGTPGADDTSPTSTGPNAKASDHGKADQDHGAPANNPAGVETPNSGGVGTANTASDGANGTGAGKANPAATAGSSNAGDHPTPDSHPGGRP